MRKVIFRAMNRWGSSLNRGEEISEYIKTLGYDSVYYDTTNLEIHLFTHKYSDLEIWRNTSHIAVSKSASIFSIDIAKLIVEELK